MAPTTFESMTPAERRAFMRLKYATKQEPEVNRRFASLDRVDLALLAELPVTPPDEKDAQLQELHDRLHQGRTG